MTPRETSPDPSAPGVQRRAILVLLAVAMIVGAGLVVDVLADASEPLAREPVAQEDAQAGTWYCPATAGEGESAVLSVAGVGEENSRVTVVRYPEGEAVPDEPVEIAPGGQHTVILGPGEATKPVSVRWQGGPAAAAWRIEAGDTSGAPCEPAPAEEWHLAALDTAGGATSTLHLFNPFPVDAVARVTFATPEGRVVLLLTDNILVPAGSSTPIDLGEFQPEQPDLGATVEVLTGRLVAQGELVLDPAGEEGGPTGRALLPAATTASTAWSFGYARIDDTSSSFLSVVNTADREAAVEVRVSSPTPEAAVQEHSVPAGGVVRIDLAEFSEEPEFGVAADSVNGVPIVVHRVTTLRTGDREGLAVSRGGEPGSTWALVGGGEAGRAGRVNIYNPGAAAVNVDVVASADDPPEWRAAEIPPNGWRTFSLADVDGERSEIPVVVLASGPVVAELRVHYQSGPLRLWTAVGVPSGAWTGPPTRPPVRRDPALSSMPLGEVGPAEQEPPPEPADLPPPPDPEGEEDPPPPDDAPGAEGQPAPDPGS